ncbi:MAG: hypothetical protein ABIT70_03465 [Sulfuriferula sp.]
MKEPLLWNTLDEAASWLSKATGETWTARHVLNAVLSSYEGNRHRSPPTYLKAALPRNTLFGFYEWDADKGTPSNPFVRKHGMPWQTVPLYPVHAYDLLRCGETMVSIARRPDDYDGVAGQYVFIEPLDTGHIVKMEMVGVAGQPLNFLALSYAESRVKKKLLPVHEDKLYVQSIANKLWVKDNEMTQAAIIKSDEIAPYKKKYKGRNTLLNWLREIDPRPIQTRRGRPSKNTL